MSGIAKLASGCRRLNQCRIILPAVVAAAALAALVVAVRRDRVLRAGWQKLGSSRQAVARRAVVVGVAAGLELCSTARPARDHAAERRALEARACRTDRARAGAGLAAGLSRCGRGRRGRNRPARRRCSPARRRSPPRCRLCRCADRRCCAKAVALARATIRPMRPSIERSAPRARADRFGLVAQVLATAAAAMRAGCCEALRAAARSAARVDANLQRSLHSKPMSRCYVGAWRCRRVRRRPRLRDAAPVAAVANAGAGRRRADRRTAWPSGRRRRSGAGVPSSVNVRFPVGGLDPAGQHHER